jgi:hypothetical protein
MVLDQAPAAHCDNMTSLLTTSEAAREFDTSVPRMLRAARRGLVASVRHGARTLLTVRTVRSNMCNRSSLAVPAHGRSAAGLRSLSTPAREPTLDLPGGIAPPRHEEVRDMAAHILVVAFLTALLLGTAGTARAEDVTNDATPSEASATEQATEPEPGELRFVHDAEGAPALRVELDGGALGSWVVQPGTTVALDTGVPLQPDTYSLTVRARDGTHIATWDVPVSAGFTTIVTAYADQHGRLLFIVQTPDGEETIRPIFEGTLVVEYDLDDGPTVKVVVWPVEREDKALSLGRLATGATLDEILEAGPHTLLLYADDEELARTAIFVVDDQTTVVRVSDLLDEAPSGQTVPPAGTDDESSGVDFPVPERVETGRTGEATWPPIAIAALTAAAILAAFVYALGRRTR